MLFKKKPYTTTCVLLTVLIFPSIVFSNMQSLNYQMQSDSINFGGGNSSSASYKLEDTIGEVATGDSSSLNYQMRAGYQQMNGSYISISGPTSVNLGSLSGIVGGASVMNSNVDVITDSYGGYQMTIRASTTPALTTGSNSFIDYVPFGSDPDYEFIEDINNSNFGFSASGSDVIARLKNNGTTCNTGSNSTPQKCWLGLSTTSVLISERSSSNHPTGTATTFYYRAQIGSNTFQEPGVYQADLIVTAIAL